MIKLKDQPADLPQPFGPFSSNIQLKQLCKHICSFWPTLSISLQFWIFGGFSKILYIFFKFNSKILLSLFSSNVIFVARHYFSKKNWLIHCCKSLFKWRSLDYKTEKLVLLIKFSHNFCPQTAALSFLSGGSAK